MDLWVCFCGLLEDLWLAVGCFRRRIVVAGGVCGGLRVGLAVMVAISGDFGCGFCFILFYVLQTHNVKYFLEHFPKVQTNIGKTNIFL
jgi:hypothetical protein